MNLHNIIQNTKTKKLYGFGRNDYGQLGLLNNTNQNSPQQITFFDEEVIIQIAVGGFHSLILASSGLYAFGRNDYGQLGLSNDLHQKSPQKISFFDNYEVTAIAAGQQHSLVLTKTGLFGFGKNSHRELGLFHQTDQYMPQRILFFDDHQIFQISAGDLHSLVLTKEGLFSFGGNEYGQLGLGFNSEQEVPQKVTFFQNIEEIIQISSGQHHSLISTSKGIFSVGFNLFYQLGLINNRHQNIPQKIQFFDDYQTFHVSAGVDHSLILTNKGLFCVGSNEYGQLGLGSGQSARIKSPEKVSFFDNDEIFQISAGHHHSLVLAKKGLFSFGANYSRQLGLPFIGPDIPRSILFFDMNDLHNLVVSNQKPKSIFDEEKNLQYFFLKILNEKLYTNFEIKINNKNFLVHKAILNIRCPALLDDNIPLKISSKNFKKILNFIYTNDLGIQLINYQNENNNNFEDKNNNFEDEFEKDLIEIYSFSEKFKFTFLKTICFYKFIHNLKASNVLKNLIYSLEYECLELQDECFLFLSEQKSKISNNNEGLLHKLFNFSFLSEQKPKFSNEYEEILQQLIKYPKVELFIKNKFSMKLQEIEKIKTWREDILKNLYSKSYSLQELRKNLYERKEKDGDFSILISGKPVTVHKFIVASQWIFFSQILLREKEHNLEEVDSILFEKIIKYYYLGSGNHLDLTASELCKIISLSDYYELDKKLTDYCTLKLPESLSRSSWREILSIGIELDDPNLQKIGFQKTHNIKSSEIIPFVFDLHKKQTNQILFLKTENEKFKEEVKDLKKEINIIKKEKQELKKENEDFQKKISKQFEEFKNSKN